MIQSKINDEMEMNTLLVPPQLYWNRVFHPTDFSEASSLAFAHALKLATREQGRLTILHTEPRRENRHWKEFPKVRQTLEKWKILPPSSTKDDLASIGLDVEKIAASYKDPIASILHYLKKHPHDLIVLATHQYEGLDRLKHKPIAESIARRSGEMTLFIPAGIDGFISIDHGTVQLQNILIPVDRHPNPQLALEAAASIAATLSCSRVVFTVLHVGSEKDFPKVHYYESAGWQWIARTEHGNVEQHILQTADQTDADLIVMATAGHHGFLDALRGSTTERIVRHANCPVLAVPGIESDSGSLQEAPVWMSAD